MQVVYIYISLIKFEKDWTHEKIYSIKFIIASVYPQDFDAYKFVVNSENLIQELPPARMSSK